MAYYELTPAYGRDYKTKAVVIADFEAGKDFAGDFSLGFAYCNKDNFRVGDTINLRFKANLSVTPYKVKGAKSA